MAFQLYFAGGTHLPLEEFLKTGNNGDCYLRLLTQLARRTLEYRLADTPKPVFIDSGAWSAHTKGVDLDISEYIEYTNKIPSNLVDALVQVDSIPGKYRQAKSFSDTFEAPKKSWQNYLYMLDKTNHPDKLMPVFHQHEDFKWLKNMLDFGVPSNYIGISPANDVGQPKKEYFIQKCFEIIKQSSCPDIKTHAFGMTNIRFLTNYPFYSADSTSWLIMGANGIIYTPRGSLHVSKTRQYEPDNLYQQPEEVVEFIKEWVKPIGVTLDELDTDWFARVKVNVFFMKQWADNYKYTPVPFKSVGFLGR